MTAVILFFLVCIALLIAYGVVSDRNKADQASRLSAEGDSESILSAALLDSGSGSDSHSHPSHGDPQHGHHHDSSHHNSGDVGSHHTGFDGGHFDAGSHH